MDKLVEFIRKKDYKFVKEIGQGSTGRTVLLMDELINECFVCKKYSPLNGVEKEVYFTRFVEEIKLLHLLYHRNVVRIFNYYLYPDHLTGYILMEFVRGVDIETFVAQNPNKINTLFEQTIEGFRYLEAANILHRDIRPLNILVSDDDTVKIIDFGFGKKIEFGDEFGKSISLNWLYSVPDEFSNEIYDFKTEIYFVAKLFEDLIVKNRITGFAHNQTLKAMTSTYISRIKSFFDVARILAEGNNLFDEFDENEKGIYQRFVNSFIPIFASMNGTETYLTDVDKIILELEKVYQTSMLEKSVQNVVDLARVFVKGGYKYWRQKDIL